VVPIAPSRYFRHRAHRADPTRRSTRARRDDELRVEIRRRITSSRDSVIIDGQQCLNRSKVAPQGRDSVMRAPRVRAASIDESSRPGQIFDFP
jgi:hypothetical protein